MYLFLRYNHHFKNCNVSYDIDNGEMELMLNNNLEIEQDNIVYDIDSAVYTSDEMGLIY